MSSNATGSAELPIRTSTTELERDASVASLANGGWLVVWHSYDASDATTPDTVNHWLYDADGNLTDQWTITPGGVTPPDGYQFYADGTALPDGSWVVAFNRELSDGSSIGEWRTFTDGTTTFNQVDSYGTGDQTDPSLTTLADGGWVVTWSSYGQDGDSYGIYQQRYSANGETNGDETLINTTTVGTQDQAFVTALADGGWVVSWESQGVGAWRIYQQRYDLLGAKVGSETLVNGSTSEDWPTAITGDGHFDAPTGVELERNDDGSSAVDMSAVFENGLNFFGTTYDAHSIFVNTNGSISFGAGIGTYTPTTITGGLTPMIAAFWADIDTRIAGSPSSGPVLVDVDPTADVVTITWDQVGYFSGHADKTNSFQLQLYDRGHGDFDVVFRYDDINWTTGDSSGGSGGLGGNVAHAGYTAGDQTNFYELPESGDEAGILNLENEQGNTGVDGLWVFEVRSGQVVTGSGYTPEMASLTDGGWVVTWWAYGKDGDGYGIYQQRFGADGNKVGGETLVNTYTTSDQNAPSITGLSDGGWVVTWESQGNDGSGYGIYQQRYDADGNKSGGETLVNLVTTGNQTHSSVTAVADGGWVVSWQTDGGGGQDPGVYQRHFAADVVGGNSADNLTGTNWDESIFGNGGNDTLFGKRGDDAMTGGGGNDTYIVNSEGDTVDETGGSGNDTVRSSITWTLGQGVENLTLTGTDDIDGTGNSGGNALTGNSGNNTLDGAGGDDAMAGGGGNDTYIIDSKNDTVDESGGGGNDTVRSEVTWTLSAGVENLILTRNGDIDGNGNGGDNKLVGNAGNNTLDGAGGDDTMAGGDGNDTYVVDSKNDTVDESGGSGTDTVKSEVTWTLGAGFENLTLTKNGDIDGTGNGGDNNLTGNSGNNTLDGAGGDDTMAGGAGDDTYIVHSQNDVVDESGGGGTDTVRSEVTYTLGAGVENLILTNDANTDGTGNGGDNKLTGNSGNNTLDGAGGDDVMAGGAGDDTYVVDSKNDTVNEAGGGTDTVESEVTWTLGAGIENLTLTKNGNIDGTGNAGDNVLTGNAGDNALNGGDGNDTLIGGGGTDVLIGGAGNDSYFLDKPSDSISDTGGNADKVYVNFDITLLKEKGLPKGMIFLKNADSIEQLELRGPGDLMAYGSNGDNSITGNSGNNVLKGFAGKDALFGGDGNDTLRGGSDADSLNGGDGNDTVDYGDQTKTTGITINLASASKNTGYAKGDTFTSIENVIGSAYSDKITGTSDANALHCSGGNDVIEGGGAGDDLFGEGGSDRFIFRSTSDSTQSDFDTIHEFGSGDRIDLSLIDANSHSGGNQKFDFIGTQGFHGHAGELHYAKAGTMTVITADVDGDGTADLEIHLNRAVSLTDNSFVL